MKKEKRLIYFFIAIFILFVVLILDSPLIQQFVLVRNPTLTDLFVFIDLLNSKLFLVIFVSFVFFLFQRTRKLLPEVWWSMALAFIVTFVFKVLFQRERPFVNEVVSIVGINALFPWWDYSFPSFTAVFVFAMLFFFWRYFPKFRYVWTGFAIIVSLSRAYFGVHYFSDLIAGALLGIGISYCIDVYYKGIVKRAKNYLKKSKSL